MNLHRLLQQNLWLGLILLVLAACSTSDETPELLIATTKIQIPCTDPLEIQLDKFVEEGQPHLVSEPNCGVLPEYGVESGTTLAITGQGFASNTQIKFLWKLPSGVEFHHRVAGENLEVTTNQNGAFQTDIFIPYSPRPPSEVEKVEVWELKAHQGEIEKPPQPLYAKGIREHILISSIGSLLGIVAGGGLSYVFAIALRTFFTSKPRLRKIVLLLPWRTVLMSLILPLVFPFIIVVYFGLGAQSGIISVGLIVFLLALAICTSILLEHWCPTTVTNNIIAWMRTLVTASVVLTFFTGVLGTGGIGFAAIQAIRLLQYEVGFRYYAVLITFMLAFDLLLGVLQYIIFKKQEKVSL